MQTSELHNQIRSNVLTSRLGDIQQRLYETTDAYRNEQVVRQMADREIAARAEQARMDDTAKLLSEAYHQRRAKQKGAHDARLEGRVSNRSAKK